MFELRSTSFLADGHIPIEHTVFGMERSPELAWSGAPAETVSFALLIEDTDKKAGTWAHWVIWNLPGDAEKLPEGMPVDARLPAGVRQGRNSWRTTGFRGFSPRKGKTTRYIFRLYALNCILDLPENANRRKLLWAMRRHVLAETSLTGYCEHPGTRSKNPSTAT